jgi:hypothetical protein
MATPVTERLWPSSIRIKRPPGGAKIARRGRSQGRDAFSSVCLKRATIAEHLINVNPSANDGALRPRDAFRPGKSNVDQSRSQGPSEVHPRASVGVLLASTSVRPVTTPESLSQSSSRGSASRSNVASSTVASAGFGSKTSGRGISFGCLLPAASPDEEVLRFSRSHLISSLA